MRDAQCACVRRPGDGIHVVKPNTTHTSETGVNIYFSERHNRDSLVENIDFEQNLNENLVQKLSYTHAQSLEAPILLEELNTALKL